MFRQIETKYGYSNTPERPRSPHRFPKMNINVIKCKRLHIGPTNPHNNYTIAGIDLDESDQERDLGIIVDNKLKYEWLMTGITSQQM